MYYVYVVLIIVFLVVVCAASRNLSQTYKFNKLSLKVCRKTSKRCVRRIQTHAILILCVECKVLIDSGLDSIACMASHAGITI
jgi:hypothetical protein